ncbi:DUF3795 domain-containing protein [Solibaculum intestinale]|uniref:DUF3795 domain-containing protein n=1 Tax=Solibaculum intestinale TaxID=3133165 RepID=A0ABV1DWH3_9FIRM
MKGFDRKDLLFSLCGLNCGLCSMHLGGYCPGCGGGEGNQTCAIARCSLAHGKVEYCGQCVEYPCKRYENAQEYDGFITRQNQRKDMQKAMTIGWQAYQAEQEEKAEILHELLEQYNDGRRKTFYGVAVNLLELADLRDIRRRLRETASLPLKEKAAQAAALLQETAEKRRVVLKLRKKPPEEKRADKMR